jgi:hypothetical protein
MPILAKASTFCGSFAVTALNSSAASANLPEAR